MAARDAVLPAGLGNWVARNRAHLESQDATFCVLPSHSCGLDGKVWAMIGDRTLVLSPKLVGIGVDAYLAARNCEPRIIVKTIFEAVSNPDATAAAFRVAAGAGLAGGL